MSQKSCSATGPASRHSSKQGKEAKKETQSQGTVSLFYVLCASILYRLRLTLCTLPFVLCLPCVIGRRRILHHFVSCTSPFTLHSLCCVVWSLVSALCLSCFASPALSVDAGFFITSSLALHLSRFISLRCVVWRLVSALCLSCFASPALSVDAGFFITSSLALHLSRFILCAVSFGALSLHFAFRALPPLRYQSTPDSSSLRLLHFTFRASFLCAVSFGALPLAFRLSVSYFP